MSRGRIQHVRKPKDAIAIICGDKYAEYYYFTALKADLRLTNVTIIKGNDKASPSHIVTRGRKEADEQNYNKVYCIFDQDNHTCFDETCRDLLNDKKLIAIPSARCFEIWVLLHFGYTAKYFATPQELCNEIKKKCERYQKTSLTLYTLLKDRQNVALASAKTLESNYGLLSLVEKQTASSTRVHHLVQYLQSMSNTPSNPS